MNDKNGLVVFTLFFVLLWSLIPFSYAQTIPITISGAMDEVIFDGRWTFTKEWKASSFDKTSTADLQPMYIRTAQMENYI